MTDYTVTATGGSGSQTLTTIAISPACATIATGAAQQFSAVALDQSGNPMTTQPTFAWSAGGGGTVSTSGLFTAGSATGGPFTITASGGGKGGTAKATIAAALVDLTDGKTGVITAQGQTLPSAGMANAFDNSTSTLWIDSAKAHPNTRASWIQYQFNANAKYAVTGYTITSSSGTKDNDPTSWALLGSNDNGSTWTALDSKTGESFSARLKKNGYQLCNTTAYNVYRLRIDLVANPALATSVQIAEMELIGVKPPTGLIAGAKGLGITAGRSVILVISDVRGRTLCSRPLAAGPRIRASGVIIVTARIGTHTSSPKAYLVPAGNVTVNH